MQDAWVTREITLRDMFCHRSGLPPHAGDTLEDIGYGRREVLHRLRYVRPATSFRSRYGYTNFGLTAAAVAAAKAAGKSWEELSAERLYRPLGMGSTSSRFADFMAAPNRALGHVQQDGSGGWRNTRAIPMRSRRPAGSPPRRATWRSGCACSSAAAASTAARSSRRRRWTRPTARRSSRRRPPTR